MSNRLAILALSAALAAGGCTTLVPESPGAATAVPAASADPSAPAFSDASAGRAMVAVRTGYDVALAAAIVYGKLPTCSATQRAPCHDAALLKQMQKADTVAFAALDAADALLRQPALGATARDRAVAAAQSALAAFTTLTGAIK